MVERHGRRDRRYTLSTRRPRVAQPIRLPGWRGGAAALACALPILMGFALPVGFLLKEATERGLLRQIDQPFLAHLATSLGLACAATAIVLVLGIVVVTTSRLYRNAWTRSALTVAGLGYAVPGTVLALGLLGPLVAVDGLLNVVWRAATGDRLGLVLMGSAAAIVVAYTIRFLPIATGSLLAGLDRVSGSLEDAARTLGAKPRTLMLQVQLPLLKPALASAALLVFVDCLKELSATLLLRPLNTETLATLVYGHASRGAFEDGSLAALVIVLVGLIPVMLLVRGAELRQEQAPAA
jgi:iron(III) transport system permease protein